MLPAAHRLRKSSDFQKVYKGGKTLKTALFRIKTVKNGQAETRVGVVVPNKVLKSAVARNRKKRQIRTALKELIPNLIPGYDIVALAGPEITEADYAAILKDLHAGFVKIRFFTGPND